MIPFPPFFARPAGPIAYVGGVGGVLVYSRNGITWSAGSGPASLVLSRPQRLGSAHIFATQDAKTWTSLTGIAFTQLGTAPQTLQFVREGAASFWILTSVGTAGRLYTTTNFTSFTAQDIAGCSTIINALHWNGSLWLALGDVAEAFTSADAVTWTPVTAPANAATGALWYFNGLWLAGNTGASGITSSADLATWTNRQNTATHQVYRFADNGTRVVAVSTGGGIYYSTNGTSWTQATSGTSTDIFEIKWHAGLGLFIACGDSGLILTSPDGITWTTQTSGTGAVLIGIGS